MSYDGLLNQTIKIKGRSGLDEYGEPELDSGTDIPARVEPTDESVVDNTGQTKVASLRIFVEPSVTVTPQHKAEWNGVDWQILKVQDVYTGPGVLHHKEILV